MIQFLKRFWRWLIIPESTPESTMVVPENTEKIKKFLSPNCRVSIGSPLCVQLEEGLNNKNTRVEFENLNHPESVTKIWVYNVSRMTLEADHPTLGSVKIPGNTTHKRYCLWTSFPSTVMMPKNIENENGGFNTTTIPMNGLRFVDDLINPDSIWGSIWDSKGISTSIGRDFSKMGVFYSYSNPPKEAEVDLAVQRMEKRYKDLLERISVLYLGSLPDIKRAKELMKATDEDGNPLKLTFEEAYEKSRLWGFKDFVTPEHHYAAEYFNLETPWHLKLKK